MRRWLLVIALANALALAGILAAVALSGEHTASACTTASATAPGVTVPGHSVGVDGTEVKSIPGVTVPGTSDSQTVCVTATATDSTVTVGTPPPPPPPAPAGTVFCFGDPAYGFQGNYTSNGWARQYPYGHPERVSFDDSVSVMQSLGCHTVRAELQAGDLDVNGGKINLRAQLYKDPNQALYDAMGTNPGQTTWYGTAFSTNPGYVPQSDPNFPEWNGIFTWHGTLDGGGNPIGMEIATKAYSSTSCSDPGFSYVSFADGKPHLMLEVNGGDPAKWPTGGATCKRIPGPVFVPGHLYRVQEKVIWSDNFAGAVQWWVDGVKYADLTGVCTLQLGGRVWALFQNYRPYAASFPTADVYYGGLVKGASQADVTVP